MIAPEPPHTLAAPPPATTAPAATAAPTESRASLRVRSLGWALLAGTCAGLMSLPLGPDMAVRSTGCGLFYGLLAFHLERVDPEDSHLRAGLVGAVCGIRSLGMPLPSPLGGA
jgi:hypothetical protein